MENNTEDNVVDAPPQKEIDEKVEHQHNHNDRATNLSKKEMKSLREHKYEDAAKKYNASYTILNKKTGLIVEMKAASPLHACTMIGWRAKNSKLIKETVHEPKEEEVKKTEAEEVK